MRDYAMVKKIQGQLVQVVPLISDSCINCTSSDCSKLGKAFNVINKNNFELKEKSIVKIGVSKISQCIQGILSLLIPIISAVIGYIFSPALAQRLDFNCTEGFQALTVLIFFAFPCIAVFVISRSSLHITLPEITQVV